MESLINISDSSHTANYDSQEVASITTRRDYYHSFASGPKHDKLANIPTFREMWIS